MKQRRASTQSTQTPCLVFQPDVYAGMQKGINIIAEAVRPTLGPLPRTVAIDPVSRGNRQPELLDNGGMIARRILTLPDRDADMGAMLLRQLLWKQHEEAGDGTVTTAVLFQSIYNQGVKYIAAGGNPMRLRHFLENGMGLILDVLECMTIPLDGQQQIAHLALSICHDEPLAEALGEIFDIIGEHGLLEIRAGRSRAIEREFVEGAYFKGGLHAQATRRAELVDPLVFISDLDIDNPQDLVRLIALAYAAEKKALVILAHKLSEKVSAVLASINIDPARFQVVAIKAADTAQGQATMLDDLAALTGGRAYLQAVGDSMTAAKIADFGRARRVWADQDYFGIVGGKGSALALRAHVSALRSAFARTEDIAARKHLRERIGKLMGGAAVLRVGGSTNLEIQMRKASAERAAEALRGALARGVLPGGGAALLACRPALRRMAECASDSDERLAYSILSRALEEPTRTILENAGYDARPLIAQITKPGIGFDVRGGKLVDMRCQGIIDSAEVIISAVHRAVTSAALALTVDVLVHHRNPMTSVKP